MTDNKNNEAPRDLEPLWTPIQVATFLTVSPVTVYRWLSQKRVIDPKKVVRFSNKVRIPRSEVERIAGVIRNSMGKPPTD